MREGRGSPFWSAKPRLASELALLKALHVSKTRPSHEEGIALSKELGSSYRDMRRVGRECCSRIRSRLEPSTTVRRLSSLMLALACCGTFGHSQTAPDQQEHHLAVATPGEHPLSLQWNVHLAWMAPLPAFGFRSAVPMERSSDRTTRPAMDDDRSGSTNVPMDSWIYPLLERLAALGLISSQGIAIRPWTRQECRRQLREAEDNLLAFGSLDHEYDRRTRAEAERLFPELEAELREPDGAATVTLEQVYTRFGTIAGPALSDGFHFGQTWWNDYGRPLGRGSTILAGYSARAQAGRFFFHVRQELQTDPGLPATTSERAALFNRIDNVPFTIQAAPTVPLQLIPQPEAALRAYVRQRPLDLYAGVAFAGNQLSFGKQEIFWGPTTMGPFSFSRNAEPTYNLRVVATRPHPFPLVPQLGSYRFDFVIGKLSGHSYPARPYFNGQKVELIFARYLDVSFTRWSVLWGVGHPMTARSFGRNFFSAASTGNNFAYGDRDDPGDRKSDFDFRLHVPGLSDYLTLYADAYADDELNPINAPRRVAWQTGLYLPRLPLVSHADFRFEMASSQELSKDEGGTRFFINNQYRDANTNKGFLLGNAVGRDARALEGRVGYWFNARTRFEAGYRQLKGSPSFLPGGSTISDGFLNSNFALGTDWSVSTFVQRERFLIPSYLPGSQHNVSARFQIEWSPHHSEQLLH